MREELSEPQDWRRGATRSRRSVEERAMHSLELTAELIDAALDDEYCRVDVGRPTRPADELSTAEIIADISRQLVELERQQRRMNELLDSAGPLSDGE